MRVLKSRSISLCLLMAVILVDPVRSQVKVKVLDRVTITQSHSYGFFPSLLMLGTGELICAVKMDGDAHSVEGNFWAFSISQNGGKTWGIRNTMGMVYKGEAAYTRIPRSDGTLLMLAGYNLPADLRALDTQGDHWGGDDFKHLQGVSVIFSNHGKTVSSSRDVSINLPLPSQRGKLTTHVYNFASFGPGKVNESAWVFFSGSIVESLDGGLLTTMYGRLEGDKYYRTFVVKSDKEGKTWQYVTTIAGDESAVLLKDERITEGFTEPRMIRLNDGRLFVLMRRGDNNMMFKSWSADDGKSWSKPVSIGFRGVKPAIWRMRSGILALSTGRTDPVTVYFSTDNGESWTNPTVLFGEPWSNSSEVYGPGKEKGTRYTDLVEVEPNKLLVVYDHVPYFFGKAPEDWGRMPESETNTMNTVYGAFLEVNR